LIEGDLCPAFDLAQDFLVNPKQISELGRVILWPCSSRISSRRDRTTLPNILRAPNSSMVSWKEDFCNIRHLSG
jgi:hypothetical protein